MQSSTSFLLLHSSPDSSTGLAAEVGFQLRLLLAGVGVWSPIWGFPKIRVPVLILRVLVPIFGNPRIGALVIRIRFGPYYNRVMKEALSARCFVVGG